MGLNHNDLAVNQVITVTLNPAVDLTLTCAHLALDELNRAHAVHKAASGKGINVSLALQQLGTPSLAVALLGGTTGAWIATTLTQAGLQVLTLPRAAATREAPETRTNIKVFDTSRQTTTEINSPGPPITAAEVSQLQNLLLERTRAGDFVVLAGSLPPGAPADVYATLATALQSVTAHIIVDAQGEALRHALSAHPYLVKPNQDEAEELLGRSINALPDAVVAARSMRALGAMYVLLSLGAQGAVLSGPEGTWVGVPPQVAVRGTAGCGDALLGGVVSGRGKGQSWEQSLRTGIAIAAASATLPGTVFATADQTAALEAEVTLRQITYIP